MLREFARGGKGKDQSYVDRVMKTIYASTHNVLEPALNWFFRRMHVIPVAAGDPPELKDASLAKAREQIEQGHIVCIFAEGSITRTGNLLRFRRGFETIARGSDAPITPVLLDGVWGSLFSFEKGTFLFKFPKQLSWPVTVASCNTHYEIRPATDTSN